MEFDVSDPANTTMEGPAGGAVSQHRWTSTNYADGEQFDATIPTGSAGR